MEFDNYYGTYEMKLKGNRLSLPREIGEKLASRNVLPCAVPVAECKVYKFNYIAVQNQMQKSPLALWAEERVVRGRTERSLMFSGEVKDFLFPGFMQSKTVTLIGNHDFFEIWTPGMWEEYKKLVSTPERMEEYQARQNLVLQL